jgi:hypothetical protein
LTAIGTEGPAEQRLFRSGSALLEIAGLHLDACRCAGPARRYRLHAYLHLEEVKGMVDASASFDATCDESGVVGDDELTGCSRY